MPLAPRTSQGKARARKASENGSGQGSSSGAGAAAGQDMPRQWLRTLPDMEHVPEDYGDAPDEHGIAPATYQALERHLPNCLRAAARDRKLAVMRRILQGVYPLRSMRDRHPVYRAYLERIQSSYQPLHHEIYTMNPSSFLVPSFLQAIRSNTEAGFRSIMTEPAPGLFVFSMLEPAFCQMLKAEVDHFHYHSIHVYVRNKRMMRTTTTGQNNYGAILSDFGLETMLDNLMNDFISPIATVLYPELGASSLDSHYSSVAGFTKDQGEGFHVDDSEVTLATCISNEFTGGDMYFRGIRCMNHVVVSKTHNQENVVYSQALGQAMLYRGRHRHGALPTSSGKRITFEMWCKSSIFRRMIEHQTDFTSWCGECRGEDN